MVLGPCGYYEVLKGIRVLWALFIFLGGRGCYSPGSRTEYTLTTLMVLS